MLTRSPDLGGRTVRTDPREIIPNSPAPVQEFVTFRVAMYCIHRNVFHLAAGAMEVADLADRKCLPATGSYRQ